MNLNKINLKKLYSIEKLDDRTYITCKKNGLLSLENIIQYYLDNGDFKKLKLISEYTDQKLVAICEKYNNSSLNLDTNIKTIIKPKEQNISTEIPNFSLSELAHIEDLSVRTINVCKRYELTDLEKILHYHYVEKESFEQMRNCGRKSIEEFVELCEKYKDLCIKRKEELSIIKNEFFEIPYYQLIDYEGLSVRSQNVCSDNGFTDIRSIVRYYWANGSFINLRKCGRKSNIELIDLSTKYEIHFLDEKPKIEILSEKPLNPLINKIADLSVKQKSLLLNILKYRFSKLSVRSSNALKSFMDSDINMQGVKFILSNTETELRNIRNVGVNSISEINDFVDSLKELIETVSSYSDEHDIIVELFNSFLIQKFSLDQKVFAEISENYDFSNGLPVFKTIHTLIENEIIFSKKKKQIFKFGFNYYLGSDVLTLDQIATKLELTKERIRQLRLKLLNGLSDSFSFLSEIEISSMNLYGIDFDCDYIVIKEDLINEINRVENTDFNAQFVLKILSVIVPDLFVLIGDEKSVLFNVNVRESYNWQNTYLISKKYSDIFDFEKFIDDVCFRLSERKEEDYYLTFQTYLLDFQKENCQNLMESISQIAEYMLFNEFELCIDTNDNIVFKRNTIKQVYEYSYHALEVLGKPSKVSAICRKVNELYPDYETDENSIRASMKKDNGFVPIGRTSIYGLKKWEKEIDDFKGGTIRDIAEEFLQSKAQPKHIDEITAFVNNYRNTTSKSIYANLNMDESKRFVFFKGLLVGLSAKKYFLEKSVKTINTNIERKTWDERFVALQKFAEKNNRLPCSNGVSPEDILYRFMNIQLRKASRGQIDDQKNSKINELVSKYEYKKGTRQRSEKWNNRYSALREFVLANNRLPKIGFEDEKLLYYFLSNQRRLYSEDSLPIVFKEKLLEIANLLN